jgi:phosphate transport system protein
MTIHFTRDLESLQAAISQMSGMATAVVRQSVATLENPDPELTRELAARDDLIDLADIRINESCLKILALHQPVARDLRRIASVMKISGELERIADVGINIAERGAALVSLPSFPIPRKLLEMAHKAALQLERSLTAYEQMDRFEAALVCDGDEEIDEMHRLVIEELTCVMKQMPHLVAPAMHLFSAARNIERVGDHATNIAEDVIYLVDGRIVRHATSISRFQRESA